MNWYKESKKKNPMEEFSYGDCIRTLWDNLLKMEKDRSNIQFDIENNDGYDIKTKELSYKGKDQEFRVKAQICWAGGDWESPICYFKCQFEDRMSFDGDWGDWGATCKAVIIPIKSNSNLIKGENKLVAKDGEQGVHSKDIDEKALWDEMIKMADERIKKYWNEYASYDGDTRFQNTGCAKKLTDLFKSKSEVK